MASRPGPFTEWPWQRLGNFKYAVLAPWVLHGLHKMATQDWSELPLSYIAIFPSLLLRLIHNQLWITWARLENARSKHRIVDRGIEFDQVDRERNWDDQIIFNGILFYVSYAFIPRVAELPLWRADGMVWMALLHAGPVEFLYYWFHRALHHHFLYSRYHSHHHASIVTEPITSVIHPFAEHIGYYMLFSIPMFTAIFTGTSSVLALLFYIAYIDFMNNLGHCNFELVPKWMFQLFPPLKYLMYTPSFHSLHHTQFRTNYSLFMPFYDYVYSTMDTSSDDVYEASLKGKDEATDVVHLTHLTTLQSIYHLRLGFASVASKPYDSKWYLWLMWPVSWLSMALTWFYGSSFITMERLSLKKLKIQTWVVPRYSFQYGLPWEKEAINNLIESAILEADRRGVKYMSLGLLNQAKELNGNGELFVHKYQKLRVRIVDGSALATAIVLKNVPPGTRQVLLRGCLSKVACAVTTALCQRGVEVIVTHKHEFHVLKPQMPESAAHCLILSSNYTPQVWIADELDDAEQRRALKGTVFVPSSHFPLKKLRNDCTYYSTPAMKIPETMQNVHSCENWLPRRVMSAWRVAGIVHALEGWSTHERGDMAAETEKVWAAAVRHGFLPVTPA